MSTITTLIAHETAQPPTLHRFLPTLRGGERERRKLTMVPEMHGWIMNPAKTEALIRIKAQAKAHFGEFVRGERVDDCEFMKRVEDRRQNPADFSHGVWAISPRFEPPQFRYFGMFVTLDWFLVCNKQSRDVLDEHPNRWHAEIDKALRIWVALFPDPNERPHTGTQLRDYIRYNARHCDGRW
jgi:hypothetical protein